MKNKDLRFVLLVSLLLAVLFILAESALLSCVRVPLYGNDPRANYPGHVR